MARVKNLSKSQGEIVGISKFPNFHKTGSIKGMKKFYYGYDALLVRCGDYIYDVSDSNGIYYNNAK